MDGPTTLTPTASTGLDGPALLDVFDQLPLEIAGGEGAWLVAADGTRYLDFYGGHAVALLGQAHPRLVAALEAQAHTLFFQSNLVPLAVRRRAGERLVAFGPPGLSRAFFVNSGAEANENALRVACRTTGRTRVVAVEGAFHGRTAAAGAVTAGAAKWYGFPRAPFEVTFVPFDDAAALAQTLAPDVAAVIVEPVQGVAGARALSRAFLEVAREQTTRHGALLIFDEVQCGMGRTGWPFAAQAHGITPDILTTAKGLAGGFPAGAMLVSERLAARCGKGDLGTTFGGGPMAAALIEAVVDVIESDGLLPRVRRLGERLATECVVGPVVATQGMGFLCGLRTTRPATEILDALRAHGILAGGSADPHVVRLLPPLVLENNHVDRLVATLRKIPA